MRGWGFESPLRHTTLHRAPDVNADTPGSRSECIIRSGLACSPHPPRASPSLCANVQRASSLGRAGDLAAPDLIDAGSEVDRIRAVATVEDIPGSVICLMGRAPAYAVVTGTSVDPVPPEAPLDPVVVFLPDNLVAAVAAPAASAGTNAAVKDNRSTRLRVALPAWIFAGTVSPGRSGRRWSGRRAPPRSG